MKNIYYGVKTETQILRNLYDIMDLKSKIERRYTYDAWLIRSHIHSLKQGASYLLSLYDGIIDEKVFIFNKNHEYMLNVGEIVTIENDKGKITKKEYDAVNDTMHYYTDIVVEKICKPETIEQFEKARLELLTELKELYCGKEEEAEVSEEETEEPEENEYNKRNKEEIQKAESEYKGFWAWLFGR